MLSRFKESTSEFIYTNSGRCARNFISSAQNATQIASSHFSFRAIFPSKLLLTDDLVCIQLHHLHVCIFNINRYLNCAFFFSLLLFFLFLALREMATKRSKNGCIHFIFFFSFFVFKCNENIFQNPIRSSIYARVAHSPSMCFYLLDSSASSRTPT